MSDPSYKAERRRAKMREYRRRHREKMKATPEGTEALRVAHSREMAAYYERHKDNPEFVAKKRARQRAYHKTDAGAVTTSRYHATAKGQAYLERKREAQNLSRTGDRS